MKISLSLEENISLSVELKSKKGRHLLLLLSWNVLTVVLWFTSLSLKGIEWGVLFRMVFCNKRNYLFQLVRSIYVASALLLLSKCLYYRAALKIHVWTEIIYIILRSECLKTRYTMINIWLFSLNWTNFSSTNVRNSIEFHLVVID